MAAFFDGHVRIAALAALAALALGAAPLAAQRPDTTRAGVVPRPAVPVPPTATSTDTAARRDTNLVSPLTPKRAFVLSLLAPGYSQTVLGRPTAAAIFVLAEAASITMIIESSMSLKEARRLSRDSVYLGRDDEGKAVIVAGPMPRSLVHSRQAQVEDWIAVLFANHVFAGADAYVAAHLWDVPLKVGARTDGRTTSLGFSFRW